MEHKLCGCPNDIPPSKKVLAELPPRPLRMSEPHFKIGGKTSPGRFSRHFYNQYPNSGKEDERSDRNSYSVPSNFAFEQKIMKSPSMSMSPRLTLSPVREHPVVLITVNFSWPSYFCKRHKSPSAKKRVNYSQFSKSEISRFPKKPAKTESDLKITTKT